MAENVESGGGSAEEQAEAEKFNRMVDEGIVSPRKLGKLGKEDTPRSAEIEFLDRQRDKFYKGKNLEKLRPLDQDEAERIALEKLLDAEEIFLRSRIFGRELPSWRTNRAENEIRADLANVRNLFHTVREV